MGVKTLTLPFPPSVNSYWRVFRGRKILSKPAREFRTTVLSLLDPDWLLCPAFEASSRLRVTMEFYPPDKRVRDISNLPKGVEDALTHGGVWADDSQIDDLRLVRREVCKPGRVLITIEEL